MTSRDAPGLRSLLDRLVTRDLETGLTRGMQVLVAQHGTVLVDVSYGRRGQDDQPIGPATPFAIFSTTKPLTATAVHLLAESGDLTYHDPVIRFLPEFGAHGKQGVTLRHLLLHQSGIPDLAAKVPAAAYQDFPDAIAQICALEPDSAPGERADYHPLTGAAVLAEVVQRVSGEDFRSFSQREIFDPLGMGSTSHGLPPVHDATDTVGRTADREPAADCWRSPEMRSALHPAIGGYSTARDLGRFFQMWLDEGTLDGRRFLSPATTRAATAIQARTGSSFGFGYGFMVGVEPAVPLSRGSLCSPRAFGHPGLCSSQTLADPETGVVIVLLANVDPGQQDSDRRFSLLCDAIVRHLATESHKSC